MKEKTVMERTDALKLWTLLSSQTVLEQYAGEVVFRGPGEPQGFHQWVDGRPTLGITRFTDATGCSYHFVVVIFRRIEAGYYLVLYTADHSDTVVQFNRTEAAAPGKKVLIWRYKPSKQDGRNDERKQYYETHFGNRVEKVGLPSTPQEAAIFVRDCFRIAGNRNAANNLSDAGKRAKAPPPRTALPDKALLEDKGFPEGKDCEQLHLRLEGARNQTVVRRAKEKFKQRHGRLYCEVCGFDFEKQYGTIGMDFIEAHHIVPVSELGSGARTFVKDLVMVCANCHRMIHRKRPWLTRAAIKTLLRRSR